MLLAMKKVINLRQFKSFVKKPMMMYVYVVMIGIMMYGICFGFRLLNPTYVDWCFEEMNDIGQAYLGWKAYRYSNWFFPIGLSDQLAWPGKSSTIFTASIPIAAFFFKLISPILPDDFQYFGLWGFMDFLLVGIFTSNLVWRKCHRIVQSAIAGIFLQISEMLLARLFVHTGLSSCWLILIAMEPILLPECYRNDFKKYCNRVILLGVLASSIHMYYLAMCGICIVGKWIGEIIVEKRFIGGALNVLVYIVTCISCLFLWGAFGTKFSYKWDGATDTLGVVSFNLINLFNPRFNWSTLLREHQVYYELNQVDGYLGAGGILLWFAAILTAALQKKEEIVKSLKRNKQIFINLSATFIIAFLVAVSFRVTLGNHIIFEVPVPQIIYNVLSIFRASSRFSWILGIIIILTSLIFVVNKMPNISSIVLLLSLAVIQIVDLRMPLMEYHERFDDIYEYESVINDIVDGGIWKEMGDSKEISTVVLVNFFVRDKLYPITDWTIEHGKKQNYFYFGRPLLTWESSIEECLNHPDDSMIFIFNPKNYDRCMQYDLNYYITTDFIIGYTGKFESVSQKIDINTFTPNGL